MEIRNYEFGEVRLDKGSKSFRGLAAPFYDPLNQGTTYQLGERLWERIAPTAFNDSLQSNPDILALINHDMKMPLGRTGARTLRLGVTDKGLEFELDYDGNDPDHRRAKAKCASGAFRGCSFGFLVPKGGDRFVNENGKDWRVLESVQLREISIVTEPAYRGTMASCRWSADDPDTEARYLQWVEARKRTEERLKQAEDL